MSFHEVFIWTLLRSLAAAGLAVPMSVWLLRVVRQATGTSRYWLLLLVLSPLVAPDLIVGYSYRSFELSLLHRPSLNHCFYFVLVLLKFLPAAVVVRICSPPAPVSSAALHCAGQIGYGRGASSLRRNMRFQSELLQQLPVFGIVFLLAMQEFEIASLLQIPAWTVYLFDAQAGGLLPEATLNRLVLPVLVQMATLLLIAWSVRVHSRQAAPRWRLGDVSSTRTCWPGIAVAVIAAVLLGVIPLCIVGLSGLTGIMGVLRNEVLVRSTLLDLAAAMAIAMPCAVLSLVIARKLRFIVSDDRTQGGGVSQRWKMLTTILTIAPGLFGVLAVSTAVLLAVQHAPLTELRSTVWPMAFALTLFLIPRAFLLTLLMPAFRDSESGHLALLLHSSSDARQRQRAASLKWWCELRPLFVISAVLFYWSLTNLTAAALLCPPTIPLLSFDGNIVPLPVRLYKFIHQGGTATLSVMVLLSVVAPLLVIVLASRFLPRFYMQFFTARTSDS